MGIVQN